MNASTGNTSTNSEAEELCRQGNRDYIASAIGKFSTKRRCARTLGVATRSTSHCRIDKGRRQRRRECFASQSSGVADGTSRLGTNSWSLFQRLFGDNGVA